MSLFKKLGLSDYGFNQLDDIYHNLSLERLTEETVINGEGVIGLRGATMVDTGEFTGRSPKDKYFVNESSSSGNIWWGDVNQEIDSEVFDNLYDEVVSYYNANNSKTYIFDGYAGADEKYQLPIRIIAQKSWQAHFANNMFIRQEKPIDPELFSPDFTIINASGFKNKKYIEMNMNSENFIIFNIQKKIAIIGGTEYGGEMKKGIFSILHYYLPLQGVLSMHCSANIDNSTKIPALFFGLSGTGKTTLSTDPNRPLIGDDEHGWSDDGIFNFEGGCYAKVINLDFDAEPDIYNAIRFGALLENVCYDNATRKIDFSDSSKTENTRVSYPLNHIENSMYSVGKQSVSGHPNQIIFLTCDAYGVLPAISKLTNEQAMYHFISGYTAKVAGTERGITEPQATFSPCFGGPFLTLHPIMYANLLSQKIKKHNAKVYLVNTGWIGGGAAFGGKRISIQYTRKMITAILDGSIEKSEFNNDNIFNLNVPISIDGIDSNVLDPKCSWENPQEYDKQAAHLAKLFIRNFKKYGEKVGHLEKFGPMLLEI